MEASKRVIDYFHDLPSKAEIVVGEDEEVLLRLLPNQRFEDVAFSVKVAKNGRFEGVFADIIRHKGHFSINIELEGEGAYAHWLLSSIGLNDDRKSFEPSVLHLASHTEALMESYGVAAEKSRLAFSGVSEIKKYARKVKTRQSAKIIVFDPTSDGKSSPVLKIADNDVEASHAAVVGRLNEDHLYYLQSRGISREEARRLIAMGYLVPVLPYFEEKESSIISDSIKGGLFHV